MASLLEFLVDREENNNVNNISLNKGLLVLTIKGKKIDQWYARSGGWGKGALPWGGYVASGLRTLPDIKENDPYKGESFPWVISLRPKFKTDRTDLAIHPDGNVPGSLGCIVLPSADQSFFYTMRSLFLFEQMIPVEVKKFVKGG